LGWLVRKLCICHGGVKGILGCWADIAFIRVPAAGNKVGVVSCAELCLGWLDTPRGDALLIFGLWMRVGAYVYTPRYDTPGCKEEVRAESAIGQEGMRFTNIKRIR